MVVSRSWRLWDNHQALSGIALVLEDECKRNYQFANCLVLLICIAEAVQCAVLVTAEDLTQRLGGRTGAAKVSVEQESISILP